MIQKLEKFCRGIIYFIAVIFSGILLFYAFESSFSNWYEDEKDYIELLFPRTRDNIMLNILMLIAFIIFFLLIYKFFVNHNIYDLNIKQKILIFAIVFILSYIWICTVKIIPTGDESCVQQFAGNAALNNDWTSFEAGGYMSEYYQQIGLFTIMYALQKVHSDGWKFYQVLNCAALSGIILLGYSIAKQIWKTDFSGKIYIILQFLCLPAFILTTFIYGELVSTFFLFLLIYETQQICNGNCAIYNIIIIFIAAFMSIWIRKNALIVLLAVIICLLLQLFRKNDTRKPVILSLAAVVLALFVYHTESDIFVRSHIEKTDRIPATAWIVMGLEKNSMGYGAYNAYSIHTFAKNGFDTEKTNQEACERIREIFTYYSENPKEAVTFFKEKILWQWTEPSFGSFLFTKTFGNQGIIWDIYYGKLRKPITGFMNQYQNLIYLGIFAGIIICVRNNMSGINLILPTSFIGYFLFSMIWEAKPRYMVMCYILVIPFAAGGIEFICEFICEKIKKLLTKHHFVI
jgi:hypothetical protein